MFNFHSFENMAVAITPENMTKHDKIWWHDFTENKQENWARRCMGYTFSQWQEITFAKLMSQHDDMSDKTLSEVRATRLTPINPTCCNWFQAEPPCDIDNNVESDDANTYPMTWDYCHAKLQQARHMKLWFSQTWRTWKHAERPLLSAGLSWRVGAHASRKKHQTRGSSTFDPTWPGDSTTGSQTLRKYRSIFVYTYIHTYIYIYISLARHHLYLSDSFVIILHTLIINDTHNI